MREEKYVLSTKYQESIKERLFKIDATLAEQYGNAVVQQKLDLLDAVITKLCTIYENEEQSYAELCTKEERLKNYYRDQVEEFILKNS